MQEHIWLIWFTFFWVFKTFDKYSQSYSDGLLDSASNIHVESVYQNMSKMSLFWVVPYRGTIPRSWDQLRLLNYSWAWLHSLQRNPISLRVHNHWPCHGFHWHNTFSYRTTVDKCLCMCYSRHYTVINLFNTSMLNMDHQNESLQDTSTEWKVLATL